MADAVALTSECLIQPDPVPGENTFTHEVMNFNSSLLRWAGEWDAFMEVNSSRGGWYTGIWRGESGGWEGSRGLVCVRIL